MKNDQENPQLLFDTEGAVTRDSGPVTCLGMTFPNDEERRKHFLGLLREKLKDPEFRKIEGFPIGSDEDILALSDPPYYTACPNPFIADFIAEWEKQKPRIDTNGHQSENIRVDSCSLVVPYHREPFAADVSEGKNDPIYNAHSYHTKVPHKAIMRYILHYTEPGDVIFDGFCGTGMTGVAAQMCGDREVVESLGYKVDKDGVIYQEAEPRINTNEHPSEENYSCEFVSIRGSKKWKPFSKLGARRAVLNDLSPAATFIAYNYNTPVDVQAFEREAKRILKEVEDECGWMYETLHVEPASSRLIQTIGFSPCNPFQATELAYRRDNLPHIQVHGATYFITFRTEKFRALSAESRNIALNAIRHWDGQRWKLFSAVVMPDHVHIVAMPLIKTDTNCWDLSEILHSIKSFSANEINKLEGKTGTAVWQTESYDRVIRDGQELANVLAYLNHNPVKAGLAKTAEEYEWRFVAPELREAGWKPAPLGKINYTVWSDVFVCPDCTREVIFWEAAVDQEAGSVRDEFPCPHCGAMLTKRRMERAWVSKYDSAIKQTNRQAKQVPVLINYTVNGRRAEKKPDAFDLALIEKIEQSDIPYWFPTDPIPKGDKTGEPLRIGITHVHHFYTKRNLWILSAFRSRCAAGPLLLWFNSQLINISKLNRYRPGVSFPYNPLSGTMYIGSQVSEACVFTAYRNKLNRLVEAFKRIDSPSIISTQSITHAMAIPPQTVDYIFIDPPFGSNLNYSELNFLWESWLKVWTNNKPEAIENTVQGKGPNEYRQLMTACFKEAYRVLKPGRWMTVEFSNTKAAVWNSIQTALTEAGFIVANVSALDKKQGSFNAVTNTTSVKQDLVISAYKPNGGFEERFLKTVSRQDAGCTEAVWDFVRTHMQYLPVTKTQPTGGMLHITERDPRILYDQMVSYYVRKGYLVPLNSAEFQEGLSQRFSYRDGMYFLPDQVAEYDKKKMTAGGMEQMALFVSDESSAIAWLRQLLKDKPQTFQDIHPLFIRELGGWQKYEKPLELSELLEQNFLRYDGKGPIPAQIVSWLKQSEEMRKIIQEELTSGQATDNNGQLSTQSSVLITRAQARWYVPDPNKAGDLEKLRERSLLKEFEDYRTSSQKRLKVFRLEAVRAGFKKAWQERDYATIITVARKIPENVLQEDPKLLMWYDQALTRSGEE